MRICFFLALFIVVFEFQPVTQGQVKTGDEVFVNKCLNLVEGKKVGIITDNGGFLQDGRQIASVLESLPNVKVVATFNLQGTMSGNPVRGKGLSVQIDSQTGIRTYSVFDKYCRLSADMLKGIDVLIYDVQDLGARRCPFVNILYTSLEAAAQNNIEYIVLDKPDMLQADIVDGPVSVGSLWTPRGVQAIPNTYGMTAGEFARMLNGERMLTGGGEAELKVVKMRHYNRNMWYDETGLKWTCPIPDLRDMNAVELYSGIVLLEATNVSEGRGTDHPYEIVGAPFIDGEKLAALLDAQRLPGVKYEPIDFTPHPDASSPHPKFAGDLCHGVRIVVTNRTVFRPSEEGVYLIWAISRLAPAQFTVDTASFDRRSGSSDIRAELEAGKSPEEIVSAWGKGLREFESVRMKYLLY